MTGTNELEVGPPVYSLQERDLEMEDLPVYDQWLCSRHERSLLACIRTSTYEFDRLAD